MGAGDGATTPGRKANRRAARVGGGGTVALDLALRRWHEETVYSALGLAELWLVDTAADQVLVYRRSGPKAGDFDVELEFSAGETLTTPLIPGFALDLAALFDR